MIHSVSSTDPQFRTVHLGPGLNIVLAERTKESSDKDSRNGLGKTSLIEIIHFCLGSKLNPSHILAHPELRHATYSLDLDLGLGRFIAARCPEESGIVQIKGPISQITALGYETKMHKATGLPTLPVAHWNDALGRILFGLTEEELLPSFTPTFRSLIGYFIRRGAHAFSQPFEHFSKQIEWDKQVNTAHLLQLDWRFPHRWQLLREKDTLIKAIKKSAKEGIAVPGITSTDRIGDLEASRVDLEDRTRRENKELSSFQVHPQYRDLEQEASRLTAQLHDLNNQNVSSREMLSHYEAALRDETQPPERDIQRLYREAGILLPDQVTRRLEDVREFHARLIRNRRDFLQDARQRIAEEVATRDAQIQELTAQRAGIMSILQTHGALEEYTRLQQRSQRTQAQLADLCRRIDAMRRFDQSTLELKADRAQLSIQSSRDFTERHEVLEQALSLFNQHSHQLYDAPGRLVVEPKENTGYTFDYHIERKGSQGVNHMVTFCYDLMLARLWARKPPLSKGKSNVFLVHDSTQFDGADERQFTQALHLAQTASVTDGFQYLCCLNSDRIPDSGFPPGFNWRDFVRLTLTDGTEDGGLFGFRIQES